MKANRGLTLVEAIISMFIFLMTVAVIFSAFDVGNLACRIDRGELDIFQPLRLAMDGMTREIRQSSPADIEIEDDDDDDTLTFAIGSSVIYYYRDGNNLVREHPDEVTRILAQNVTVLNFSNTTTTVTIQAEAQQLVENRLLNISLTQQVRLRNGI